MTPADGIGHTPPPPLPASLPRCEHVWVTQQTLDNPRLPGILLAWRKHWRHGWEGWVVYATPGIPAHGDEPHLHLGWVASSRLQRIPARD